jgi:hypothetical protein
MKGTATMEQDNSQIKTEPITSEYDKPQVEIGQVVATLCRQVAVPYWHQVFKDGGHVKVGSDPCIKIGDFGEDARILTGYNQKGLVCFMPKRCYGGAMLSAKITSIHNNSVSAEPIEWIEIRNPEKLLTQEDIGEDCDYIISKLGGAGIWHNKRIA